MQSLSRGKKTLAQRREEAAARKAARLKEKEARKQAAPAPAPPTKLSTSSPGGMKLSKKAAPAKAKESKVAKIKDMVEDSGWDDDW